MTLLPLLDAPPVIQAHVAAAIPALLLGPVVLWRRRRDTLHRLLGRVWVAAMVALAVTGLLIPSEVLPILGPFGQIHALSLLTLWSLWQAVAHARAGRIDAHRAHMRHLYLGALVIAGAFTLTPGRRLHDALFADAPHLAVVVLALVIPAVALAWRRVPPVPGHPPKRGLPFTPPLR
jgi:uncharacterized membrane protein